MLITPNFIFIHIPKTAGRFCRHQIVEHAGPVLYRGGLHEPAARVPEGLGHLPLFAFIRNPWDWYVSWYFHMQTYGAFNPLYACALKAGHSEFDAVLQYVFNSLEPGTREAAELDHYLASPEHAAVQSHDLDAGMVQSQRASGHGMLSWRFAFNVGETWAAPVYVGRFESLCDHLIEGMARFGVELDAGQRQAIRTASAVGEGQARSRRDYRDFFTSDKLIERLAEKEMPVIERFGYQFD